MIGTECLMILVMCKEMVRKAEMQTSILFPGSELN